MFKSIDESFNKPGEMSGAEQCGVAKTPHVLASNIIALRNHDMNRWGWSLGKDGVLGELTKLFTTVGEIAEPVVTRTPR